MIATPHRWWDDHENGWEAVQALSLEITERLSKLVIEAGEGARLKQVYDTFGIAERPTTPEEFVRIYRTEGQQWIAIARELGITLD